jgi:hypothetical protein
MAPGHETVIRAVGSALAGLSAAFAIYMLAYGAGKTRINGMEHLAIFAQPRGPGGAVRDPAPPSADAAPVVDMATTGSVAASVGKAGPDARPVEIVAAQADRVWLRIDGAIRMAAPGDTVAGLGRIGAIVARNGGWVLLDDTGAELLAVRKARTAPRCSPASGSSNSSGGALKFLHSSCHSRQTGGLTGNPAIP